MLTQDITGVTPSITVMAGKNTTVLEMDYCVLDFILVTDTPWQNDLSNPESIIVLLSNDLMAIDCRSTGFPTYENPYAMDFQVATGCLCQNSDPVCPILIPNDPILPNQCLIITHPIQSNQFVQF